MGLFKKFIDEVKAEWNRQQELIKEKEKTPTANSLLTANSLFSEEQLKEMEAVRIASLNWCAKANAGAQRYGMPKIGKVDIHTWIKHNENKTSFTTDELMYCKTMYLILDEWINNLVPRDEDGFRWSRNIQDQVLKTYIGALQADLWRLEKILKNNNIPIEW